SRSSPHTPPSPPSLRPAPRFRRPGWGEPAPWSPGSYPSRPRAPPRWRASRSLVRWSACLILQGGGRGVLPRHDTATPRRSSYGSSVAGDRIFDPDLARRLVLHEARAQQTPARELRDLGDGWLLHDPSDAEPFWNRLIAPRWPEDSAGFDRRLDEVITLFASLARLP